MDHIDISEDVHAIIRCFFVSYQLDLGCKLKDMPLVPVLKAIRSSLKQHRFEIGSLKLNNNNLFGVITTALRTPFPAHLHSLDLSHNDLHGFIAPFIQNLPLKLRSLHLNHNHFSDGGSFPWEMLPKTLETLSLQKNEFRGKIDWRCVPPKLSLITVSLKVAKQSVGEISKRWSHSMVCRIEHTIEFVKTN